MAPVSAVPEAETITITDHSAAATHTKAVSAAPAAADSAYTVPITIAALKAAGLTNNYYS